MAPARRSKVAERKVRSQQSDDGDPVCGFESLLKALDLLCVAVRV